MSLPDRLHPGGNHIHDLGFPTVGTDRHPAPDNFPEAGHIGFNPIQPLCALVSNAKTGHHLVENQDGSCFRAGFSKGFQKPGSGGMHPIFPATGSRITAATSPSFSRSTTGPGSL